MNNAAFRFAWLPLWQKRFLLESLVLEDGELQVVREPEGGWIVGVVKLAGVDAVEEPVEPSAWQMGLRQIEVRNTRVSLLFPQFTNNIEIDSFSLDRAVAWEPDSPATVSADYALDGAPASLEGQVFPFRKHPEATGHLKVEGVDVGRYAGLLQPMLTGMSGKASADMEFSVIAADEIRVSNDGDLEFEDLVVTAETFETSKRSLGWSGKIELVSAQNAQNIEGDGTLKVAGLDINLPGQTIAQEEIGYAGRFSVALADASSMPVVGVEGELSAGQLDLKIEEPATALTQGKLAWSGSLALSGDEAGLSVESDGTLELDDTNLELPGQVVTDEKTKWSGTVALRLAEDAAASTVNADGSLESGNLSLTVAESGLKLEQSDTGWQGKIALTGLGESSSITSDGTLKAGEIRLDTADVGLQQPDLSWEGQLEVKTAAESDPEVVATGALATGGLDARLKKQQLQLLHQGVTWNGRIGNGAGESASAKGELDARGIALRTADGGLTLASADSVKVDGLSMPGAGSIDVSEVQVNNLAAGVPGADPDAGAVARAANVAVNGIEWRAGERTAVEAITVAGLDARLVKTGEGGWQTIDAMRAATGAGTEGASDPETSSETPAAADASTFSIGRVAVTGDSRIYFEDQSVEPVAQFDITLEEAEISALDTAQPSQESPLSLAGKLGGTSSIAAKGFVKPFADPLEIKVEGKIANLPVKAISPYAAQTIGYELTRGRFTAVMDFKSEGGQLDGDNQLTFNELEVAAVPDAESQLSIPLETGLAMLRDRDDRIRLKVPVSGDADNPDFSVADAINQALVKATEKAAVGYLALTLQPWGAVLLAADLAMDFGPGATAKLDDVTFAPGSAELKPEFREYMGKLATLLDERPDVQLRLCGRAVKQDADASAPPPEKKESKLKKLLHKKEEQASRPTGPEALAALARARGAAVLNALVEEHAVPEERIYTCDPEPDATDEGEPRVDVGI
jgi:outer membrane protein OmpA-like peptidoglycan-associated protein